MAVERIGQDGFDVNTVDTNTVDRELARRTLLGGGVGLAAAGALGLFGTAPAFGQEPGVEVAEPRLCGTGEWGARSPRSAIQVLDHRPTRIIVHHTASGNTSDTSQAAAFAFARISQDWHMDGKNYIDTGQQFTISRGGHIMEGRHRSIEALRGGTRHVLGAHASNQNTYALGIENQGTYIDHGPPTALWNSLVSLIAYMCHQYGIAVSQIIGHRDVGATQCPGDAFYAMLPRLRHEVADRLGDPGDPPPPPGDPGWTTVRPGASGEAARTVQYLLRQHGHDIAVDGQFGPVTESAVRSFQSSRGLAVDGWVGQQTWPELVVTVRQGSSGEAVRGAQSQLNRHGAGIAVDGQFGPMTDTAARSFQSGQQMTADGVVGPQTWRYLIGR